MFRIIKHSIFGIREDDIQTRLKLIHSGQFDKLRPSSANSNQALSSKKSASKFLNQPNGQLPEISEQLESDERRISLKLKQKMEQAILIEFNVKHK